MFFFTSLVFARECCSMRVGLGRPPALLLYTKWYSLCFILCLWWIDVLSSSIVTLAFPIVSHTVSRRLHFTPRMMISPEPIHTAFTVATFLPQSFWLLMILLPKHPLTRTLMSGVQVPFLCCATHLAIVGSSLFGPEGTAPLAEFNQVFDPSGDPQAAFMHMTSSYPNFVAEEWSHVLTWDLIVGRFIWQDGVQRNLPTAPAVLLCNLIGPPGLLLHWATCAYYGQPLLGDFGNNESN